MKSTDLIVLGLAGVAVYLIAKGGKLGTTTTTTARRVTSGLPGLTNPLETVSEIFTTAGKTFDNGWRYFSDGTAIDPLGNYYFQGQKIWDNPQAQYTV